MNLVIIVGITVLVIVHRIDCVEDEGETGKPDASQHAREESITFQTTGEDTSHEISEEDTILQRSGKGVSHEASEEGIHFEPSGEGTSSRPSEEEASRLPRTTYFLSDITMNYFIYKAFDRAYHISHNDRFIKLKKSQFDYYDTSSYKFPISPTLKTDFLMHQSYFISASKYSSSLTELFVIFYTKYLAAMHASDFIICAKYRIFDNSYEKSIRCLEIANYLMWFSKSVYLGITKAIMNFLEQIFPDQAKEFEIINKKLDIFLLLLGVKFDFDKDLIIDVVQKINDSANTDKSESPFRGSLAEHFATSPQHFPGGNASPQSEPSTSPNKLKNLLRRFAQSYNEPRSAPIDTETTHSAEISPEAEITPVAEITPTAEIVTTSEITSGTKISHKTSQDSSALHKKNSLRENIRKAYHSLINLGHSSSTSSVTRHPESCCPVATSEESPSCQKPSRSQSSKLFDLCLQHVHSPNRPSSSNTTTSSLPRISVVSRAEGSLRHAGSFSRTSHKHRFFRRSHRRSSSKTDTADLSSIISNISHSPVVSHLTFKSPKIPVRKDAEFTFKPSPRAKTEHRAYFEELYYDRYLYEGHDLQIFHKYFSKLVFGREDETLTESDFTPDFDETTILWDNVPYFMCIKDADPLEPKLNFEDDEKKNMLRSNFIDIFREIDTLMLLSKNLTTINQVKELKKAKNNFLHLVSKEKTIDRSLQFFIVPDYYIISLQRTFK